MIYNYNYNYCNTSNNVNNNNKVLKTGAMQILSRKIHILKIKES